MPGLVLRSQVENEINVAPSFGLQGLPAKEKSLIQDSHPEDYSTAFPQVVRGESRVCEDSPAGDLNTLERRCGEAFHVISVLSLILHLRTVRSHAHKSSQPEGGVLGLNQGHQDVDPSQGLFCRRFYKRSRGVSKSLRKSWGAYLEKVLLSALSGGRSGGMDALPVPSPVLTVLLGFPGIRNSGPSSCFWANPN